MGTEGPRGLSVGACTRHLRRGPVQWALLGGLALLAAGCAIGGDVAGELPQNALNPAGPVAREQDNLWDVVFPIAVVVFVFVQGALLYCIFRFRSRGESQPPRQLAGNTRLELIWTAIPAVVLAAIAVPTVQTIFEIAAEPGEDALQVRVVGKQFWWAFEYLGEEGQGVVTANDLHIPTDRPVQLRMEALSPSAPDTFDPENPDAERTAAEFDGVIHSFWVPRLAGKQDVIPGHERLMTLEAEEPGVYPGQCAEFCGIAHAEMKFRVIAEEPAEFEQWIADQAEPAAEVEGLAAEGQDQFGVHCVACHAVDGHPENADIRVGPDLTHFASREFFAGGIFPTDDEEQLAAWLQNPQAEKPGAQMPNLGLSEDQIDALVAYLQSLE